MNLPNILTIARVFFVPLLVAALVAQNVSVRLFGVSITNVHRHLRCAAIVVGLAGENRLARGHLARGYRHRRRVWSRIEGEA